MATTRNGSDALDNVRARSRVLRAAALVVFIIIVSRLGWLQLARGGFYRNLSEDNYVQGFEIHAPRGRILDRNGEILADNRAALSITLSRMRQRDDEALAASLAGLLELPRELVDEKLEEVSGRYYGSVPLIEDATLEQVSRVEERRATLPGVKVVSTARRRYLSATLASHALGYVAEVSDPELQTMAPLGYRPGDVVGKSGVERRFELLLRGRDGVEYWVCDASGVELYPFEGGPSQPARPGMNLVLTIDAAAQAAASEALSGFAAGAVVALEPSTGEVLVLASQPAPDSNSLVDGLTQEEWHELSTGSRHPLLNRCVQATYPPGSQFKLITAGAGLETGDAVLHHTVNCRGAYKYGIRTFRCWRPEGHGTTDLLKGITESCDVYFYQLGTRLGVATLMDWTERAGFGRVTGIDIAGEVGGNVPTPSWYDRRYGKRKWSRGVVLNLAIGQGELLVTPLQAACLTAGIVNDGLVMTPHLFKRAQTYSGRVVATDRPVLSHRLPFSRRTLAFLKGAMVNVVESQTGTGKQARIRGMEVGGKTGTAQNPHGDDHSWFVSFAPAHDPRIVVAVVVENAGSGAAVAAPIARKVTMAYLGLKEPAPVPRTPDGGDTQDRSPDGAGPSATDAGGAEAVPGAADDQRPGATHEG
ncbi:MAG: penicillin-binding protein 2 [Candidatus Eisenbacteria bacterium]